MTDTSLSTETQLKALITPCPVCSLEEECPHTPVRCRHEWLTPGGLSWNPVYHHAQPGDHRTCEHCGRVEVAAIAWKVVTP